MSILFVADIHLSNKKPKVVDKFLSFLNNQAINACALYILGDLFEIWLGDDDQNLLHIQIAQSLKRLTDKKIPCYFIHGNHDFLLGSKYAKECGMILLPNYKILQLSSGIKIIVLHGDALCINDKKYLKLQKILNCHFLQKIFLSLPFFIREYIFNAIFVYCKKNQKYKSKKQLNIDNQIVIKMLIQNQSNIIIHGHTHQPAVHEIHYSKQVIFHRIVLGNWDENSSSVLQINEKNNTIDLMQFFVDT